MFDHGLLANVDWWIPGGLKCILNNNAVCEELVREAEKASLEAEKNGEFYGWFGNADVAPVEE